MDEEVHGASGESQRVDHREAISATAEGLGEQRNEIERMRDEWTSVIVHELRQPVTAIATQVGLLLREDLEPRHRTRLEHILTSTRSLGQMVTDLSDYSRINVRSLELEPREIELRRLVEDTIERLADELANHRVRVEFEERLPTLRVDPSRLEQVIANLLINAAKHGAPDSEIDIRGGRAGADLLVEITNQGAELEPEELDRIFDRFVRGSRSRRVIGLGLGLHIAKGLVEAHGGRIWATSSEDGRVTFSFSLPASS